LINKESLANTEVSAPQQCL